MSLLLGYNTNGFAHHRLEDCLSILADLGYGAVALTLDVHHLDPYRSTPRDVADVRARLDRLGLVPVIETGARYLLDPRTKHEPTLLSPEPEGRARRLDFLYRSIDLAAELGAGAISFWSGRRRPEVDPDQARTWLVDGLRRLADRARPRSIDLAFEPEPGMFVEGMADFEALDAACGDATPRLTLDLGHLLLTEPDPIDAAVRRWADRLVNVHVEDMRRGAHDHLLFGEGEMPFEDILRALVEVDYRRPMTVELSRHSHAAPEAAARSKAFLDRVLEGLDVPR